MRKPVQNESTLLHYSVYRNGLRADDLDRSRRAALAYCRQNDAPDTVLYIRCGDKLVYYQEHGQEPIYLRGFHKSSDLSHPKALIDYDRHTPKDVALFYDAVTDALEHSLNPEPTHTPVPKPKKRFRLIL